MTQSYENEHKSVLFIMFASLMSCNHKIDVYWK